MPVLAITCLLLTLAAIFALDGQFVGPLPGGALAITLAALLLGAGAVALGVALGEWVRFSLAPLIAVVGVAFATLGLNNAGDPGWNPFTQLSTAPALSDFAPIFERPPAWWHLLWIVALVVVVAVLAVARHDRSARVGVAAGMGALVAAIAGVGATRPLSSGVAASIAARIAAPAEYTTCAGARPVRVCTFPGYEGQRAFVLDEVAAVAAVLPASTDEIVVRHALDGTLAQLPPEIRRRLPDGLPALGDREVPLAYNVSVGRTDSASFGVALAAMDLPPRPDAQLMPLVIAGQSRGVVALWLATRGATVDKAIDFLTPSVGADATAFERGSLAVGDCEVPPVVWSQQDLAAARALVGLPEATVRAVVGRGWDRWTDPATSTDALLGALGLDSFGPYDVVEPQPGNPC